MNASDPTHSHKIVALPLGVGTHAFSPGLALVGEGPARSGIEARSRQRNFGGQVSLVGACKHDRVADYCRESDTFVLSSFSQGVPVILMEAMAIEPPSVATWMTGIPEIIKRDVEGLLVPPASPAALADAIEGLMADPDSARRLGAAGREERHEGGAGQRLC